MPRFIRHLLQICRQPMTFIAEQDCRALLAGVGHHPAPDMAANHDKMSLNIRPSLPEIEIVDNGHVKETAHR